MALFYSGTLAPIYTGIDNYPRSGFMHIDLGPARSWGEPFTARAVSERLAQRCRYRRLRMHAAETDQTHQAILEIALAEYLKRTNA